VRQRWKRRREVHPTVDHCKGFRPRLGVILVRRLGFHWIAELTRRLFQFATQYPHGPRGIQGQGDPVAGHAPNLDGDVLTDVNPFASFPAEYEHRYKLLVLAFAFSADMAERVAWCDWNL
jgi:hypothetical protein